MADYSIVNIGGTLRHATCFPRVLADRSKIGDVERVAFCFLLFFDDKAHYFVTNCCASVVDISNQYPQQITQSATEKMTDFAEVDKAIDDNPKVVYEQLKEIYDSNEEIKTNIDLLWRLGKACFLWANTLQKKDPKKKLLILEGRTYATSAYTIDENNAEALRWAAILIGSATDFLGPKEKIEQGKIFKAYLDRAIQMQSTEYSLLHSRGRFSYEVANLTWIEKRLCSALFSEVPHGTIDEALSDFLEAEKYSPFAWPENLLYIARCYAVMKNKELAKKYLEKVEMIEHLDEAEAEALIEVKAVVSKLR
ncbi:unnamed protein product [Brugia timori]|uniref:Regulator of microtubule dynamics protein 2 n=1 Tax=Brugia timori TaxID=42155 RepID=A0A0R3QTC2_9BILA|nr:unnamed protein product [Brugia timori]